MNNGRLKERFIIAFSRKKNRLLLAFGAIGLGLLLLSELLPSAEARPDSSEVLLAFSLEEYRQELCADIGELIARIEGAGEAQVLLTLDSSEERILASELSSSSDEASASASSEREQSVVVARTAAGAEEGLLLKLVMPRVRGVAIVCEGADSAKVRADIIGAVSSSLGIGRSQIYVASMNKNTTKE